MRVKPVLHDKNFRIKNTVFLIKNKLNVKNTLRNYQIYFSRLSPHSSQLFLNRFLLKDNGGRSDVIANGQGRLLEDDFVDAITEEEFGRIIGRTGVKSAIVGNDLRSTVGK